MEAAIGVEKLISNGKVAARGYSLKERKRFIPAPRPDFLAEDSLLFCGIAARL